MAQKFDHLFSPLRIGERTVKNRIVSAAHNTNLDRRGLITQEYADYIVRRSQGGPGMVVCFGAASVHEGCGSVQRRVSLWNSANDDMLTEIAERVHRQDCLLLSQAAHIGRRGESSQSGRALQAPSEIPEPVHLEIPHVLSVDEIHAVVESFADAARRLERCGWDGLEITSYAGQLIEQFWSPGANKREDLYGGDFAGRMRFSAEVLEAVRNAVSRDFIVGFRMTGDPGAASEEIGLARADMLEIASFLQSLGCIDLFHISGSSGSTKEAHAGVVPPPSYSEGCYLPLAREMKEVLSVPVIGTGRILSAEFADRAVADGDCDLVGMVRALIADPDLPNKALAGRSTEIRPCISIISGCSGRTGRGNTMGCSVNPLISYPALETNPAVSVARRIVVVGAGPAGLEAARVAATRGHQVTLFEAEPTVGGQVRYAARADGRRDFLGYVDWLSRENGRLGVDVRLNVEFNVVDVVRSEADAIIVATGSTSFVPEPFLGLEVAAATDLDLLDGSVQVAPSSNVLVYDVEGGFRGASIANFIAEAGASSVELATPLGSICQELDKLQQPWMYRKLCENSVTWSPNSKVVVASGGRQGVGLTHLWSGKTRTLNMCNLVVFVGYRTANSGLLNLLRSSEVPVDIREVGDCVAPRRMLDATADGVREGRLV